MATIVKMSGTKERMPTEGSVKPSRHFLRSSWQLYLMVLPAIILTIIFVYIPIGGLVIAFQDYKVYSGFTGSKWIGLEHFRFMFELASSRQVLINTLILFLLKLCFNTIAPLVFALLLNEVRSFGFKRSVQTLVYLPHFMSWVILGGILIDILGQNGIVNNLLHNLFNLKPIPFLLDGDWYRFVVIVSDIWKEFGFSAIIFLAALTGISPSLYESAEVDGANRWQQTMRITLPSLIPIIIVVLTLSIAGILGFGLFDQIFNTYNPLVYDKGDVIDTFVYRNGVLNAQYGFATAIGMFKSVIGMVLVIIGYRLAYKYADYKIL